MRDKNELSAVLKSPAETKHSECNHSADQGINMHPEQMFPDRRKMQVKFLHNLMNNELYTKITGIENIVNYDEIDHNII